MPGRWLLPGAVSRTQPVCKLPLRWWDNRRHSLASYVFRVVLKLGKSHRSNWRECEGDLAHNKNFFGPWSLTQGTLPKAFWKTFRNILALFLLLYWTLTITTLRCYLNVRRDVKTVQCDYIQRAGNFPWVPVATSNQLNRLIVYTASAGSL